MRYYIVIFLPGCMAQRDVLGSGWHTLTTRGGPVRFTKLAIAWKYCKRLDLINKDYGDQWRIAMLEVVSIDGEELPLMSLFNENNDTKTGWTKCMETVTPEEEEALLKEFEEYRTRRTAVL